MAAAGLTSASGAAGLDLHRLAQQPGELGRATAPPRSTNIVCGELQPCWSNAEASAATAAAVRRAVWSFASRSAPTIAQESFGPKIMSSVPYRLGRLTIASTAFRAAPGNANVGGLGSSRAGRFVFPIAIDNRRRVG